MEIPIKMDDLGVKPTIFGNIHIEILGGGSSAYISLERLPGSLHFSLAQFQYALAGVRTSLGLV